MMGEAIEQRRGHLGIGEDARPFPEGEIGGDNDRCTFVKLADQMEEQLPASLSEGQIAEFVKDHEIHPDEVIGEPSLATLAAFALETIDEIEGVEEASPGAAADAGSGDRDGEMALAGA